MSDWSQRKSWNNDGMDPDWRPSPPPEPTDEQIIRNAVDVLRRKGVTPEMYKQWLEKSEASK